MEAFDKVEELLLAEGYSKEEIPAIMVSLVEQGFDPTQVFLGGLANMLDLLPKKRKPEPLPKTKAVADLLPDTQQPKAPKPEFGANASKPTLYSKPTELRPGGRTPEPQFRTNQPVRNVNPARNNLFLQKTNLRAPSIPKPPVAVPGLFGRLKNVRGGPLSTAVNLATGAALDKYVVEPVAKAGGDALARGILDVTGHGERARQVQPSLYGKSGPDLTPDIVRGVQQRSKLAQQRAETQAASQPKPQQTGERSAAANAAKQETAKAEAQRRRVSAADFDRTFAAARANLKQQGKDPNTGTFSWRGKSYSTKLK